ncbi:hypothetical protein BDK51DRAFT_38512 [Blyttiomyces helicus]|uniref:Uncharacterized protein n=1 Tax=Blyttiomyces helicus TaxID=388810 RepID=A0A4P9W4J3_9FUNG|nr:hypothetical protein BDK51DRAFT_38512 [Blyttiomyces helicus]|eukprot:RKO87271.1 hypothetical protein BDK51DRAFT_38512 [Blyttiomyces helicus]
MILNAAYAFSLGRTFRRGALTNIPFLTTFTLLFTFLSFLLLADPNPISCLFRVNCGTKEALAALGYSTIAAPIEYHSALGHNVLPRDFRWKVWALAVANLGALVGFEACGVLGVVREWARRKWPAEKVVYRV